MKSEKIKKECLICKSNFFVYPYRGEVAKFCSYKCYAESMKGIKPKWIDYNNRPEPWNKGKPWSKEIKDKFSKSHKGKPTWNKGLKGFRAGKECHFWKGGISYEPYTSDWTETLKRAIREKYNYICQICSQYGNEVHHIDYDKKNCNPNNLITLCHNCHAKTNGNRDYWIKYFKK